MGGEKFSERETQDTVVSWTQQGKSMFQEEAVVKAKRKCYKIQVRLCNWEKGVQNPMRSPATQCWEVGREASSRVTCCHQVWRGIPDFCLVFTDTGSRGPCLAFDRGRRSIINIFVLRDCSFSCSLTRQNRLFLGLFFFLNCVCLLVVAIYRIFQF